MLVEPRLRRGRVPAGPDAQRAEPRAGDPDRDPGARGPARPRARAGGPRPRRAAAGRSSQPGRLDRRRVGEGAQQGSAHGAAPRRRLRPGVRLDATGAGHRHAPAGRGASCSDKVDELQAQIDDRRSRRNGRRSSPSRPPSRSGWTSCRSTPPSPRAGHPSSSPPICRPTPSNRSRCARWCSPASSGCCSGWRRRSSSTTSTTRSGRTDDLEALTEAAGARRRPGRTAAGQPSDRPQRAARVRRRDLPRPAHQRAVPRPRPGAAGDPGDQLAAR